MAGNKLIDTLFRLDINDNMPDDEFTPAVVNGKIVESASPPPRDQPLFLYEDIEFNAAGHEIKWTKYYSNFKSYSKRIVPPDLDEVMIDYTRIYPWVENP